MFHRLLSEIKIRHYSPKTLKAYRGWTRQFQAYREARIIILLSEQDVIGFLSYLAVEKEVSASSQSQAFNALLFLFKQVLKKDFGEIKGVPRLKWYRAAAESRSGRQRPVFLEYYGEQQKAQQ